MFNRPAFYITFYIGLTSRLMSRMTISDIYRIGSLKYKKTRRALGRAHVPPTKVFPRLAVNKTILKPPLAAATGGQYVYVGFSRRNKIPRCIAYTISEKAIRFRHPDYNPDRAQNLISSSTSRHLSSRNISSKSMHAVLSNLANIQTDRQTNTGESIYLLLCRR